MINKFMINYDSVWKLAQSLQESLKGTLESSSEYIAAKTAGVTAAASSVIESVKDQFIIKFDLSPLDLSYGLHDSRDNFLKFVLGTTVESEIDHFRINRINNVILSNLLMREGLNEGLDPAPSNPEIDGLAVDFQRFYELAHGPMKDSMTINHDLVAAKNSIKMGFISRHCKMGILWNVHNNRKIHYVLDDLNLPRVFSKGNPDSRGYTASEIRFIYRLFKSRVLTDEQRSMIKFYKKGTLYGYKEVPAPWETDPSIVGTYSSKNRTRSWQVLLTARR